MKPETFKQIMDECFTPVFDELNRRVSELETIVAKQHATLEAAFAFDNGNASLYAAHRTWVSS